ncbi:MgtC/SapB family protein [Paenibacillus rigui]|uniref:Magnesium transporter MgtC n=1 Tax=Paenibacillus rigui TaxID=554312 RepID=A0A229UK14_9BACL|nr:MgtC/SapB family protein [Paenibacillus rigui]OXM83645.1 magnesium transporter MgtC [Paenibacillus rigui]
MASTWEISHLDLIVRMVLAAVLGGLIGMEREWSNHAAGFRTHILVCLGSATIMLMSIYGFTQFVSEPNVRVDPARLAAQVISGIGFLGAGAIMRNGSAVKGLTTAASVWTVAAIGLCVGAGFYTGAFVCTGMVLVSLYALNKWEKHLLRNRRYHNLEMTIYDAPGSLGRIATIFGEHQIQISDLRIEPMEPEHRFPQEAGKMLLAFKLKSVKPDKLPLAVEAIRRLDVVSSLTVV